MNCLGLPFWVLHMKRWIFQLMDTQVLLIASLIPELLCSSVALGRELCLLTSMPIQQLLPIA